ncbi:TetR/AcrR family transcriptional regulator C-terminal domain-containing protein [Psychromicrobium lacuslunae]|uniref:HTH tetR-type domain-containing protein n=1 Tax=Psychromicrobium lacuslunae TaxID=1618207 RepID=A0A0D4C0W3_9MICC|nr:TetR/AcrR family transcriptional regulator C-terminal domain-containing protein [Psychromicrobium lacuslunae]AJT42194.1 hypothetical protein UM93_13025 [Psychromicrobium lacuslunae]
MPYPARTDRTSIVSAAIDELAESGLDSLSLRAIAARLGVRQPGLYHHFSNKSELLDAVADEVLERWHTARLPREQEKWDEFIIRNAQSLRRALLSIRDGARLLASTGSRSPNPQNAIAQISLLEKAGFSGTEAVLALIAVSRYTIGAAIEQQTARDRGEILIPKDHQTPQLERLREIAQRVGELGQDHEFNVGLLALVRGLAVGNR